MTRNPWHLEESLIYIEVENLASRDGVVQTAARDLLYTWESEDLNTEDIIQDPKINSNNTQITRKREVITQTSNISSYYTDQKLTRFRKQRKIKNINRALRKNN